MTSSRRIHRRALVGLGALLLVLNMWPFICVAAIPVPSMMLQPQPPTDDILLQPPAASDPTHIANDTSDLKTMLNTLNETTLDHDGDVSRPNPPPTSGSQPRPSLITDDGNNTQSTSSAVDTSPVVRTIRSTRIDTVNSVKHSERQHAHDEIAFKINPTSTQTDLNLNTPPHTTKTPTIVDDSPELHQNTGDDDVSDDHYDYDQSTSATNHRQIGHSPLAASHIGWATESNNPSAGTDASSSIESVEFTTAGGTGLPHHRRGGVGGTSRNNRSINQPSAASSAATGPTAAAGRKRNSHLERNERSANLSHIMGTARKIQLLMKNRMIQILPDGTVNGTQDDQSEYTILQRGTVGIGQIRIQAVATCLFLCMDACGNVYATREFVDDCIFNEAMQENYNIYSSLHHSTAQRTYYLALNKLGQPRKTHLPAGKDLGKLATYAKSLTYTVPEKQTLAVIGRVFGANHVKHGLKQLCDSGKSLVPLNAAEMRPRPVCAQQQQPTVAAPSSSSAPAAGPANRGQRKHKNGTSSLAPDRPRKGGGRCMEDPSLCPKRCMEDPTWCQKRRKINQQRNGGGGGGGGAAAAGGVAGGTGPAGGPPGQLRARGAGKKPRQNKKGHRRKKVRDGDLTAKVRGGDRATTSPPVLSTTTDSPADDDDPHTDHFGVTSTDSSSNGIAGFVDDDGDQFDGSIPATGFTSFAADDMDDDFSD